MQGSPKDKKDRVGQPVMMAVAGGMVAEGEANDVEVVMESDVDLEVGALDVAWVDGETLLTGSRDGKVRVWEWVGTSPPHLTNVAFFYASASRSPVKEVQVLDGSTRADIRVLTVTGLPRRVRIWCVRGNVAVLTHDDWVEETQREDGDIIVQLPLVDAQTERQIEEAIKGASADHSTNDAHSSQPPLPPRQTSSKRKSKEKSSRLVRLLSSLCGRV